MADRVINTPLILLAGGQSSRMGTPKGLLPLGKRFWLEEQLYRFSFCGEKAIVVLGHGSKAYLDAIPSLNAALQLWAPWPSARHEQLQLSVTINTAPELGPFSSLRKGLDRLLTKTDAFVLPVDVPVPVPDVWRRLETEGKTRNLFACVPKCPAAHNKGGHPVWLSSVFLSRLGSVDLHAEDARLDRQIAKIDPTLRLEIPVDDPRVTWNINTPADFELIKEKLEQEPLP